MFSHPGDHKYSTLACFPRKWALPYLSCLEMSDINCWPILHQLTEHMQNLFTKNLKYDYEALSGYAIYSVPRKALVK